jgi:hypothetical protein
VLTAFQNNAFQTNQLAFQISQVTSVVLKTVDLMRATWMGMGF